MEICKPAIASFVEWIQYPFCYDTEAITEKQASEGKHSKQADLVVEGLVLRYALCYCPFLEVVFVEAKGLSPREEAQSFDGDSC